MTDNEEFDQAFLGMAVTSNIEDLDHVISQILYLEGLSRFAALGEDPEVVQGYAQEAFALFMDVPLKTVPTFIMAMADRFNREKEALLAALDALNDIGLKIGGIKLDTISDTTTAFVLADVLDLVGKALEDAPYSKVVEES